MKRDRLANWRREDIYPWMFLVVGIAMLMGQLALFLRHLDLYGQYPEFAAGVIMYAFSIPLLSFVGAAVMFPWTARTYSRTFAMDYPDTARRIEAVLKEEGVPYLREPHRPALFLFWRPDVVFFVDRPALVVRLLGTERPRKLFGSITQVFVGKFTSETKEDTKRLLAQLDKIDSPPAAST